MEVRRAGVADHDIVRDLRLRALRDAPDAFASTFEREATFPTSVWTSRLATPTNATLVSEADRAAHGMVVVVRDESEVGLGWLVGMWLAPSARGTGAADQLVAEALHWAEVLSFTTVRLHVTEGNDRAERLYRRHGFSRTGGSVVRDRDRAIEVEMERTSTSR